MIGMKDIKHRRLHALRLTTHPDLYVGQCVPFYFCPRSIMLYVICRANNPDLAYKGGQVPIMHLQADLNAVVIWADQQRRRWAFTLSNAGSYFFEDRNDLAHLNDLNWLAIQTDQWWGCKDGKQAEFLLEQCFPWHLVEAIGVHSEFIYQQVMAALDELDATTHKPTVALKRAWYY